MRTLLISLLTGALGAILAFIGGDMATRAHGVSNMEGGRAMAVAFLIGPAGCIVGIIVGIIVAKHSAAPAFAGFARAQGLAWLITAALAILVFGYAIWRAPRAPQLDGQSLNLEFEVRMPEGRSAPDSGAGFTVLMTSRGSGDDRKNADLRLDSTTLSEGRVVIPASAFLYTTTTQRFLVINDVGDKHYWFDLPLRASPRSEDESWTGWWPQPGQQATADINGNGGFQIRYRVAKIPPE